MTSRQQTKSNRTKRKFVIINARVPETLRDRVKEYAGSTGRKIQHVVQVALEEYIDRIGNPAQ